MARKNNDLPIKDVIRQMLVNSGLDKKYDQLEIVNVYHQIVGSVISKRTREVKLRDKTLILKMESGVVKEELSHSKTRLKQLLNDHFGSVVIEEIEIW
ncbi:MAG: DUF721 domain-containing protein [Flavobacteriales bacterium]|jgi:predicted nucleic acid-binding Zn ribbon protein